MNYVQKDLMPQQAIQTELTLLTINLTRRCNLACDHCHLGASTLETGSPHELSTAEACALLDDVAQCGDAPMVVLTGGEPLLRRDLEKIVTHGAHLGLAMVVDTNGILLGEQRVHTLKLAGLLSVRISVDSLSAQHHDEFRGQTGAWEKTTAGIEVCHHNELSFHINFSVNENNAHELSAMADFARSCGASALNVFFLICTGRGESVTDLTPQRYEQLLGEIFMAQQQCSDLVIRARCAPHLKRIARQRKPDMALNPSCEQEEEGCMAGRHYCRVTPEGAVTACPYVPSEVGNIRCSSFRELWSNSPALQLLREPELRGTCSICEYRKLCGGCRARSLSLGGDLLDSDPWCMYQPHDDAVIESLSMQAQDHIEWSDEAEERLAGVPGILRKVVQKRAEAHVSELGLTQVTTDHLDALVGDRFIGSSPQRPVQ